MSKKRHRPEKRAHVRPEPTVAVPQDADREQLILTLPADDPQSSLDIEIRRGVSAAPREEDVVVSPSEPQAAGPGEGTPLPAFGAGELAAAVAAPPLALAAFPEHGEPGRPGRVEVTEQPLGSRLRTAREARELSIETAARALRIPAAVLLDMEADRHERLGAPVYARGFLRSYARLVGVPEVLVDRALQRTVPEEAPPLVPSHTVPHSRYLASRYGNALVYSVLTIVVVVPVLWLARQGTVLAPPASPRLQALDAGTAELVVPSAPSASAATEFVGPPAPSDASRTAGVETRAAPAAALAAVPSPPRPMMASMAPMATVAPAPTAPEPEPTAAGARRVALNLTQSSWVEFIGVDGSRIEYALLPAGTRREYQVAGQATLRIGNTRGASLAIDGAAVDLAPHTRANVARIEIGSDGSAAGAE